jgi:hypothetical protein
LTERLFLCRLLKKDPYASLRLTNFASTYKSTPPLIGLRAPRLWAFLSSLQGGFRPGLTRNSKRGTRNFFTISGRGSAEFFLERPAEMREVFEAAIQGDLRNVQPGIF